jgi:hypothetical protein
VINSPHLCVVDAGTKRPVVAWLAYKNYPSYNIPEQVSIDFAAFKVNLIKVTDHMHFDHSFTLIPLAPLGRL